MSTLFSFRRGSRVKVHHYTEGFALSRRLEALGIVPGEEIVIVRNDGVCPLVVTVKGARVMLGQSIGRNIFAEGIEL